MEFRIAEFNIKFHSAKGINKYKRYNPVNWDSSQAVLEHWFLQTSEILAINNNEILSNVEMDKYQPKKTMDKKIR